MRTIARTSLALALVLVPLQLRAQDEPPLPPITPTGLPRTLAAIASTPLGAFAPVGPVMATSRDDPFTLGLRLQYGSQALPAGRSLTSYGLTTNVQIEGGAIISATVGHQRGDGEICITPSCDPDRWMAGLRYSTSIVTTRPFIELPFFNKNDATGTAALEFGGGWANKGFGEKPHWTGDVTVPLSVGVGQYVRVVTFATPTYVVAWGTTERRWSRGQRFMMGGGVTAQEIGQLIRVPGLDLSVGFQRAFSSYATVFGASISWTRIP
jgi:hypothetical protein